MPLYEYKCHSCGKTFEVLQKFADEPLKTHEGCGGEVERLLSAPAFHLKGTGWYATDYAKGSAPGPKHAEAKPTEAKTDSSSESKSESKSDPKDAKPAGSDSKPAESKPTPAATADTK